MVQKHVFSYFTTTDTPNGTRVMLVPVLNDNYAFIILEPQGHVAIIDPGQASPVLKVLEEENLKPDFIFITHHHWDHVDGIDEIIQHYPLCKVIAPDIEKHLITRVDVPLKDQDVFPFGQETVHGISTPGHTLGSMCYYFDKSSMVFTGDTLFSLGCGRVFEGTAEQMFLSINKLAMLPDETRAYCGHEYTRGNAGFCLSTDPKNKELRKYIDDIKFLRKSGKPTLPSTISLEKKTNVFMRAKTAEEFAILRHKKDTF